jgi:lysophospholipase L1-like esterase
MKGWHKTIRADLAPLTVIPRGFGGSNMNDALHYADRVVLAYKPRAVVIYEGDNDINLGISPGKVRETFLAFVKKVRGELPKCRIYFLSVKPSIKRWKLWPRMKKANELIAAECAKDPLLTYVDVAAGMLGKDGRPRKEIFKRDKLHMVRAGYEIWRDALRPVLIRAEGKHEPRKPAASP